MVIAHHHKQIQSKEENLWNHVSCAATEYSSIKAAVCNMPSASCTENKWTQKRGDWWWLGAVGGCDVFHAQSVGTVAQLEYAGYADGYRLGWFRMVTEMTLSLSDPLGTFAKSSVYLNIHDYGNASAPPQICRGGIEYVTGAYYVYFEFDVSAVLGYQYRWMIRDQFSFGTFYTVRVEMDDAGSFFIYLNGLYYGVLPAWSWLPDFYWVTSIGLENYGVSAHYKSFFVVLFDWNSKLIFFFFFHIAL